MDRETTDSRRCGDSLRAACRLLHFFVTPPNTVTLLLPTTLNICFFYVTTSRPLHTQTASTPNRQKVNTPRTAALHHGVTVWKAGEG